MAPSSHPPARRPRARNAPGGIVVTERADFAPKNGQLTAFIGPAALCRVRTQRPSRPPHFPGSYLLYAGDALSATLSALGRVGLGLLFGYYYVRSRNVVPGAISHTFYNWALVLWQVPNA